MGQIRLYRRFYRMVPTTSGDTIVQVYTLITPSALTAKVYLYNTSTLIETITIITQESTGIHYADLDQSRYSFDNTYDLVWSVTYVAGTSIKQLKTTFKLQPVVIGSDIEVEYYQNTFEIEIQ